MDPSAKPGKLRRFIGLLIIVLASLFFMLTSTFALSHAASAVEQMKAFGLDYNKMTLIGILELTSGLLLLIPRTRSIGVLMASAYLGGAMATHLEHEQLPTFPAVLLAIVWIGVYMRHPQLLWSCCGKS